MARAGAISTALSLANVAVGFAFQAYLAALLGLSQVADDYQLVWTVTSVVTVALFTMVPNVLVPTVVRHSGRLGAADTRFVLAAGVVLAAFQAAAAIAIAQISPNSHGFALSLFCASFSHLFASLAALGQTQAYISRDFMRAGIGPVANGLGLLLSTLAFGRWLHAPGILGLGISLGYAAQWLATLKRIRQKYEPEVRAIPRADTVRLFGFTLLTKVPPLAERILTLGLIAGSTAALGFGQKMAQAILLVAAFGIALVSMPSLSETVRTRGKDEISRAIGGIYVSTAACTALFVALSAPSLAFGVHILLLRGSFDATDARVVLAITLVQMIWVIGNSLTGPLTAGLYAAARYSKIITITIAGLITTIAVSSLLRAFGVQIFGVACASSLGALASLGMAHWQVRRWLGGNRGMPSAQLNINRITRYVAVAAIAATLSIVSYVEVDASLIFLFVVGAVNFIAVTLIVGLSSRDREALRGLLSSKV